MRIDLILTTAPKRFPISLMHIDNWNHVRVNKRRILMFAFPVATHAADKLRDAINDWKFMQGSWTLPYTLRFY